MAELNMDRRSFFGLAALVPSMAKSAGQMVSSATSPFLHAADVIKSSPGLGEISSTLSEPTSLKAASRGSLFGKRLVAWLEKNGFPEWKIAKERENIRRSIYSQGPHGLNPDIAGLKSVNFHTKVKLQTDRTLKSDLRHFLFYEENAEQQNKWNDRRSNLSRDSFMLY